MKFDKITTAIGIVISILIAWVSYVYFSYGELAAIKREPSSVMSFLETLDLRFNDIKYKFRGRVQSPASVALIAIDDASLREIGRWPWSRDLIAEMSEKVIDLGAKSIAFDVIFSEPEKSTPQADTRLAKVISDHSDKIILGVYSENQHEYQPYQDLCVAEAFLATGGDQIVKINPSFSIDENSNAFDDLNWNPLFSAIFKGIRQNEEDSALKDHSKKRVEELTAYQKNNLQARKAAALFDYCKSWLTDQDPFLQPAIIAQITPLYLQVTNDNKELKALDLKNLIAQIKRAYKPHPVPQYGEWTGNIPELQTPAALTASFIAQLDTDGYVRRYPLFFRSGNKLGTSFIPSLALQSYLSSGPLRAEMKMKTDSSGEKSIDEFNIFDTSKDPEQKIATLPTDSTGQLLLNFYGRQMSLPYVSAKDIFSDKPTVQVMQNMADSEGLQLQIKVSEINKKSFFKDRSFIFGATATGLYDLRNTPLEANYPGPELHLTMLANLLDQSFIKTWNAESAALPLIILFMGIFLSLAWAHVGSVPSLIIFSVVTVGLGSLDAYLFLQHKILIHSLPVYSCLISVFAAIQLYRYFTEEKKKRELKSTFSKYVSPAVVDELLKDVENLKLGGRRERMTAFFSDVRGFTTISEKLAPEELSRVLNLYLTPMTEIVFQNSGTLDKYMGDAIMAFFGAPVRDEHHAQHACRCALKSMEKLKEIQKEFQARDLPFIDIGIGINTGDMSVGNMGSNIVQNYTVMGDAVNLASRLEGINKEYGTKIIISEFTFGDVKGVFTAREIDRVRVKGKLEPVKIFELVCEGPPSTEVTAYLAEFGKAYALYHDKKFNEALGVFKQSFELSQNDPVSELFIQRCVDYIENAPVEGWDGVFVMKTK